MSVDWVWNMESFEELMAEIQCYNCKEMPRPRYNLRYKCLYQGHSLCSGCKGLDLEFETLKCPCGSEISDNHCKVIQRLMKTIPWYCRHFKHGCRDLFRLETALTDHQVECIYRPFRCCHKPCNKQLLFKDFMDHYLKCRPKLIHPTINAPKASVTFNPSVLDEDGGAWYPERFDAHATSFFLVTMKDAGYYRMWMLMLSSCTDVLRNFEWNLRITGVGKEEFRFRGEPFPIEKSFKEILNQDDGFSIGCKKAIDIKEKIGKFEVMIEICNLKEEAKDEDLESGVSSDDGDDYK